MLWQTQHETASLLDCTGTPAFTLHGQLGLILLEKASSDVFTFHIIVAHSSISVRARASINEPVPTGTAADLNWRASSA